MIKNSPIVPTITSSPPNKCYSTHKTKAVLRTKFFDQVPTEKWPKVIQDLIAEDEQTDCSSTPVAGSDLALQSFGLAIQFLEDALISDRIITTGLYSRYVPETYSHECGRMVLDS